MTKTEELYVLVRELKYQQPDPITLTIVTDKLRSIITSSSSYSKEGISNEIRQAVATVLLKQRDLQDIINHTIRLIYLEKRINENDF